MENYEKNTIMTLFNSFGEEEEEEGKRMAAREGKKCDWKRGEVEGT